ncbi:MAG: vitamin K epoxide reductase [Planctomycetes bacterium]|nr:vitamin K epoxide reductase [Planctomycetota bacterium]
MENSLIPPGWSHNPSEWFARLPVIVLALLGCGIATYLTLYQVDVLHGVWEPFFGDGSLLILKKSAIVRFLHPVPDASLGAGAYLAEVVVELIGGRDRWRTRPWVVVLNGIIALSLALMGILLTICQPVFFHHFCTLCLSSAACSLAILATSFREAWAAVRFLRTR